MNNGVMIGSYIHECKRYCADKFFKKLLESNIGDAQITVIDNSPTTAFSNELNRKYGKHNIDITHITVPRIDKKTQFHRNITESVNYIRRLFIDGDYDYLVLLESDVIPRDKEWLYYLLEVADRGDIIGGLYYVGFGGHEHLNDDFIGIIPVYHVLSGCTLYKRDVIANIPFRYDVESLKSFPDALMSIDARALGYTLINYTKVRCDHLRGGHDKIT
jgi:hypothetical protein